jgi:pimeloyl-ACP methyl ester carboxylesterase
MATFMRAVTLSLIAGCLAMAGCRKSVDYMSAARLDRGLVFCLDGVGGYNIGPRWVRDGLDEGGCQCAVYIFNWGYGPAGMFVADIMDETGNKKRAAELARLIENYQGFYPGRPVYLIGHSGGGGMVIFALEEMKPGTRVDGVFLLAPAVDPERNLAPALRHVSGQCLVTYSPADFALMGLGTSVFATMDRKHTVAAGLVGFKMPRGLSPDDQAQYRKLRQAGWDPSFFKKGILGGHMSWSSPWFAREFIAPVLRGEPASPVFQPVEKPRDAQGGASTASATGGRGGRP